MDQITHVKQQVRMEQFKDILAERTRSGMSVKEFCRYHHMAESTYYKYLKQLRTDAIEMLPAQKRSPVPKDVSFAPVEIKQNMPSPEKKTAITIHFSSAMIEVPEATNQQAIEAVLSALKNVC